MKIVKIKKFTVLVDDKDYQKVLKHNWYILRKKYPYFVSQINGKPITLQRFILNPPQNLEVDHINRNIYDNRKSNLRIANHSQNKANVDRYKNNKSGFKGVWFRKNRGNINKPWCSSTSFHGKTIHFGCFNTPKKAAKVYDKNAKKLFKEFAKTNF